MAECMWVDPLLETTTLYSLLDDPLYTTKRKGLAGVFIAFYQITFRKVTQGLALLLQDHP